MKSRKETAWRKNRKFGDVYGGRRSLKIADKIFRRAHSLERPGQGCSLPVLIEDNPSREFFFPLSAQEALQALEGLPTRDYEGITHIWCRRVNKSAWQRRETNLAEFICGSGVRAIVLYPWPKDMTLHHGTKRPDNRLRNQYEQYGAAFSQVGGSWISSWDLPSIRRFMIGAVLYHEVGHHVDWYMNNWSKANARQTEDRADEYAVQRTVNAIRVFNRMEMQEN